MKFTEKNTLLFFPGIVGGFVSPLVQHSSKTENFAVVIIALTSHNREFLYTKFKHTFTADLVCWFEYLAFVKLTSYSPNKFMHRLNSSTGADNNNFLWTSSKTLSVVLSVYS